jgi:hypothetical protein
MSLTANQSAAANRRPAGTTVLLRGVHSREASDGAGNLAAIVAAGRAFPAAVADLTSEVIQQALF